ncbi:UNVERIFIED_CONTAM: Transposon TX1 uncharacterized protein [Sesamum latifolium]|uniref:Transposon TX1 uncharacterized protein n=1 Tax=Sesamum latifolium TaxID=2727402 RepID=A0AAW2Y9E5_9LAMI
MVKWMQLILEKVIDNTQNAFVPGRSIFDNILLVQEILSGYNQKHLPPRCTIKVDLQKAYDMVNWEYLLAVMKLFKFLTRFISWVEQCISTTYFSISLDGSIHGFFPSSRGLRQRDPISPYLFVLIMESLHHKSKTMQDANFKADIYSVTVLHEVLEEFRILSGLPANAQKSQILLSKAAEQHEQQIVNLLGFPRGTLPVRYLGILLITSKLSIADCAPLLQRIDSRIAGWIQANLSYAGRTQLIKSVINAIM